jgi:hypothetical protein
MARLPKRRPEVVYVITADDQPIVAYKATSQSEARELIKERWFQVELKRRTNIDAARASTNKTQLKVRRATAAEIEIVAATLAQSNQFGIQLAYLVDHAMSEVKVSNEL